MNDNEKPLNYWAQRYRDDPEFRAKKISDSKVRVAKDPEAQRAYLREYYKNNKHKWKPRTREQRDKYNQARRTQYAESEQLRKRYREEAREWARLNPDKHKNSRLKLSYGIDIAEYNRMVESQCGGCAICGAKHCLDKDPRSGKQRMLHVDHCHTSGKVRGLLCSNCNKGIGLFYDSPGNLESAAEYLRRASSNEVARVVQPQQRTRFARKGTESTGDLVRVDSGQHPDGRQSRDGGVMASR